jgi:hypothetical protein
MMSSLSLHPTLTWTSSSISACLVVIGQKTNNETRLSEREQITLSVIRSEREGRQDPS